MLGPYIANIDGTITYRGNKIFPRLDNINSYIFPVKEIEKRVDSLKNSEIWTRIAKINHQINIAINKYFHKKGAFFTLLPLTTRMISSPGAVYGKETINYTTDTHPMSLKWFDISKDVFLSESSQIYLELSLIQKGINHVYSIYNSFRKEKSDSTHLSEFHHVEYEGKINQEKNEETALELVKEILERLLKENKEDLNFFLTKEKIQELKNLSEQISQIPIITFREALNLLYKETKNEKYKEFTLKNFGMWEEIKITEILGGMVIIKEFPLLEVPFYHEVVKNKRPFVANNADIIWPGYREFIGSGQRIRSEKELHEKAKIFKLPKEDYEPYLKIRRYFDYESTSGFGLGWERMLQGLLEMPFIWSITQFPRTDRSLKP